MAIALQPDQEMAAHWKTQIEQSEKELNRWHKRGEKISKNFRDERDDQDKGAARRYNLFYSNTETVKPAVYSKVPVPICERRFLDKDTTGRVASTILERVLRYEVSMSGFDNAVRRARNDYLIPGRGQVWIRYYPQFGEPISPKQTADNDLTKGDGTPIDEREQEEVEAEERPLLSESLCVDYVHWQDYGTLPALARTEDEVEGKYRRLYMSRSDLIDHFGEEIGRQIELDHAPTDGLKTNQTSPSNVSGQEGMQATVYEIWWKPERKVYFIAKSYDKICKEVDDPLHLEGFFPCPPPLNAVMTNDTTIPIPFYAEAQDQYYQIDDLTRRIDVLTSACKVVGAYDAASEGLKRIFQEATEPNLIPVDSYAVFKEKGGIKGAIDLVDIKTIADVLKILIEVRQQIVNDLDRLTGVNDIRRGESDARETLGAQKLKDAHASTRLQEQQDDMARFCRDIICIMGEIVSEHYTPETLIQVSGAMNDEGLDPPALDPTLAPPIQPSQAAPNTTPGIPQQAAPPSLQPAAAPIETAEQKQARKLQLLMQAIGLLRQDKLRGFRIDIETDSTVQGDQEAEKAARVEFLTASTKFIEESAKITMMVPEFAPLAAKMLMFGVRGFRVGRDLESALEDFCDKAEMDAKQKATQPPQPSPEQIKADSEREKAMAEIERQKIENEGEQRNALIDLESKKLDVQMKQMEIQIKQMELHGKGMDLQAAGGGAQDMSSIFDLTSKIKEISQAAKMIHTASLRNAAPKSIKRDKDGRATHVVTDFQEPQDEPEPQGQVNLAEQLSNAAKLIEEASKHNAKPKRIVRGANGQASSIVTE